MNGPMASEKWRVFRFSAFPISALPGPSSFVSTGVNLLFNSWVAAAHAGHFGLLRGKSMEPPLHEPFTRQTKFSGSNPVKSGQTQSNHLSYLDYEPPF